MKNIIYILALLCLSFDLEAQDMQADTGATAMYTLLHADPRLDIVLKKRKTSSGGGSSIYSGRGYRVQIYSGNDRNKANKMKVDFMRRFPGVGAYMTYVSPQFRVKVGDYRSRGEAQEMYRTLSAIYNPCMIVPDIVVFKNINRPKEQDDR
jgi:hypothetical protein